VQIRFLLMSIQFAFAFAVAAGAIFNSFAFCFATPFMGLDKLEYRYDLTHHFDADRAY
jgi:hypothetical protein